MKPEPDDGLARRKHTFLVSLWHEQGGAAASAGGESWRGSVEHLGSGRRLYFNQIASLVGFFFGWLGRRDSEAASKHDR
jgi:hypothetical protein